MGQPGETWDTEETVVPSKLTDEVIEPVFEVDVKRIEEDQWQQEKIERVQPNSMPTNGEKTEEKK